MQNSDPDFEPYIGSIPRNFKISIFKPNKILKFFLTEFFNGIRQFILIIIFMIFSLKNENFEISRNSA